MITGTKKGGDITTPRKERALQALLVSRTKAEAAKRAGVAESTLRVYCKDPEFLERYQEAVGSLVQDATRQAQQAISPALDALREVLENPHEQSQARVMPVGEKDPISASLYEEIREIICGGGF